MSETKRFWMVLRHDGRAAQVRQETKQIAIDEAKRLAIKERAKFFVLEVVAAYDAAPVEAQEIPLTE